MLEREAQFRFTHNTLLYAMPGSGRFDGASSGPNRIQHQPPAHPLHKQPWEANGRPVGRTVEGHPRQLQALIGIEGPENSHRRSTWR